MILTYGLLPKFGGNRVAELGGHGFFVTFGDRIINHLKGTEPTDLPFRQKAYFLGPGWDDNA